MKNLKNVFFGFLIGSSEIVPGFSGGTMAYVLGIYKKLINSISLVNKNFFQNLLTFNFKKIKESLPWGFFFSLFFGMLLAIGVLSKTISHQLEENPQFVWSFFTGLVLGSIPFLYKKIKNKTALSLFLVLIGFLFSYFLVALSPAETSENPLMYTFSGFIASSALILPGISGSYILVLLSKYENITDYVSIIIDKLTSLEFSSLFGYEFIRLGFLGIGVILGLLIISKLLSSVYEKNESLVNALLLGFVLGSVKKIWPFEKTLYTVSKEELTMVKTILPSFLDTSFYFSLVLILLGFLSVFLLEKMNKNN